MIFDTTLGNFGANADPVAMADTARAADELGFRALWGAHHLLPPSLAAPVRAPPGARASEPGD
jgi:alkanesulfonate monooxygenase SsuD/methylene tetrahydromethanopterin reductase-like flavin-dependent oxidoreductase (luciferase family)